ncbi:hypothetical protein HOT42_gp29 [Microbacterium phage Metamorphoo]|uniref:Uncharacterized protein n=2 Tax=Metamorphoovirus TaxID=2733195 RepID=A0A2Z4Q607_9CAUD|nr:hypothetical protein HOT42_gp29 [Microbacterium phage Metamorphoo]YP_009802893.1 hypothetical protein HOT43_gp31 [Microbacterium phage RobsFeet]AWY05380.1 hypothetical protein SEA_METAMORPHOO_29 [Microbacterium phage Metamorphoo]AWY06037.1 hypothetical protein SEA_ROBSFEET_30 [Microbacterium phage RobsFeet]
MSDPTNTDGATVNTDGQTTSAPAGEVTYPDGSTSTELEDRSADFPGEYPEIEGEPIIETRDGVKHRLGTGSGLVGYRGLAAKRAEAAAEREERENPTAPVAPDTDEERAAALAAAAEKGYTEADLIDSDGNPLDVAGIYRSLEVEGEHEQGQEGGSDAPEGSGTDDDTSEVENGQETGDEGSSDEEESTGSESEEESDGEEVIDDEESAPADEGYDPSAHTVTEVTAYLDENPDQATFVLDRERTGKARVTLIGA